MADRKIIKVKLSANAKAILTRIARELDMKEIGVASRVFEWFVAQDAVVQRGVLKLLPPGYEAEVARLALERMAAEAEKAKGHRPGR